MAKPIEEPVVTESGPEWDRRTVTTHPAFGQITVSRISGHARLYGSDFLHHNYVAIRIKTSELHRSLSNDWPMDRKELIEVSMSEAQWAAFVSSFNVGSGVQCTIEHIDHKQIPGLPYPEKRTEQFRKEAADACEKGLERLEELRKMVADMKISHKSKDELLKQMNSVGSAFTSTVPWIAKQFDEHMETTVEKAKTEVNAYATNLVMRTGLQALQDGMTAPLLEFKEKGDAM